MAPSLQGTGRFGILSFMPHVLPLLLLCAAAQATEVAQFRAEDFGADWRATRGGATLAAVHPATNGWVAAFADRGGVSFAGTNGVASPMEFNNAPTGAVAREWDLVRFATSTCLGGVEVSVDGAAGAAMPTNGTPHLVEVAFQEPVAADELYLGGHPATPAWDRAWQGRVFEALFCFGDPSATDADALRAYLSLRWVLGLSFPSAPDIVARLRALGVDPGPLYATILILR